MNELNQQFRHLEEREKKSLRRVILEDRGHYCTLVACLRPVIDEEFAMLGELGQIEEVMAKLGKVTFDKKNHKPEFNILFSRLPQTLQVCLIQTIS